LSPDEASSNWRVKGPKQFFGLVLTFKSLEPPHRSWNAACPQRRAEVSDVKNQETAMRDPVCGMTVDEGGKFRHKHAGHLYHFCSEGCRYHFCSEGCRGRFAATLSATCSTLSRKVNL
jgi:YHS domain-containing protein